MKLESVQLPEELEFYELYYDYLEEVQSAEECEDHLWSTPELGARATCEWCGQAYLHWSEEE